MKIISDDRISSISIAGEALGSHTTDLVRNDRPRQSFISNTVNETITFQIEADSTHPADGFFIHGALFDSGTWSLQQTDGTEIESGTLTVDFSGESNLQDNPNTKNVFFRNTSHLLKPEFVSFATSRQSNAKLVLGLSTFTDRKQQNTEGNAIAEWARDSANTGRFLDSSGNAVNIINHGYVFVGSHVRVEGEESGSGTTGDLTITENTLYNSPFTVNSGDTVTINNGFFLGVSNSLYSQIISITGDGTSTGAITLQNELPATGAASLINPVKLGIFRCGTFTNLPNPQEGVTRKLIDYSILRFTENGGINHTIRNVGQTISMSLRCTNEQSQTFEDFVRTFRSKPFAVLWASSMISSQNEKIRYSGFFYISTFPIFNFLTRAVYQEIDFEITEVL